MTIQQKLKSITKRLNKNISKDNSLLEKIDDIFYKINGGNDNETMVMLVYMLVKSKEVFFCDNESTEENNKIRVLREYLKLIIKKMSRCGEYKTDISHEIKDGQYSFFEVISIVHKHSMQS